MKKVLILGASGMAGHVIHTYLSETGDLEVLGTVNNNALKGNIIELNVFDEKKLFVTIDTFRPDIIINCIGILISNSNKTPDKAIYINSYLPHSLARLSINKNFKLVHLSTDCVFSGKAGQYNENSPKDATDIYGLSKSLGEVCDSRNLTIRTSIIGPEIKNVGEGLFHWFMNQDGQVYGYKSSIWSGVTTLELAEFIHWVINNDLTGLYHLTNNQGISKFDLLKLIASIYKKDINISDEKDYKSNKSLINSNKESLFRVKTYKSMIENQREFMNTHSDYYKHYKG
jgi:dTDP-4-dehydrorhamnose reductase